MLVERLAVNRCMSKKKKVLSLIIGPPKVCWGGGSSAVPARQPHTREHIRLQVEGLLHRTSFHALRQHPSAICPYFIIDFRQDSLRTGKSSTDAWASNLRWKESGSARLRYG